MRSPNKRKYRNDKETDDVPTPSKNEHQKPAKQFSDSNSSISSDDDSNDEQCSSSGDNNTSNDLDNMTKNQLKNVINNLERKLDESKRRPANVINIHDQTNMVDVNVLHLFDENHELLLRNLKSFTAHKIFSKKKFIVNPEDSKSLCISAVNNRRVMLPNGATPSEFALRYSQHLKTFVDNIRANSQDNARINYQGKRDN